MHLVQALILFPVPNFTHCKFGYFLFLLVGLYLLFDFFRVTVTIDFLPQIAQTRDIILKFNIKLIFWQIDGIFNSYNNSSFIGSNP